MKFVLPKVVLPKVVLTKVVLTKVVLTKFIKQILKYNFTSPKFVGSGIQHPRSGIRKNPHPGSATLRNTIFNIKIQISINISNYGTKKRNQKSKSK